MFVKRNKNQLRLHDNRASPAHVITSVPECRKANSEPITYQIDYSNSLYSESLIIGGALLFARPN